MRELGQEPVQILEQGWTPLVKKVGRVTRRSDRTMKMGRSLQFMEHKSQRSTLPRYLERLRIQALRILAQPVLFVESIPTIFQSIQRIQTMKATTLKMLWLITQDDDQLRVNPSSEVILRGPSLANARYRVAPQARLSYYRHHNWRQHSNCLGATCEPSRHRFVLGSSSTGTQVL